MKQKCLHSGQLIVVSVGSAYLLLHSAPFIPATSNKTKCYCWNTHLTRTILQTSTKLWTKIAYYRTNSGKNIPISLVVFSDAEKSVESDQLFYLAGIVLGKLENGYPFYVLSWQSHKSRRPVISTASAETLAASEAIDEGKSLKMHYARF